MAFEGKYLTQDSIDTPRKQAHRHNTHAISALQHTLQFGTFHKHTTHMRMFGLKIHVQ